MNVTFEKQNSKLIKVMANGEFSGWLSSQYRRTTGLHSVGYMHWSFNVGDIGASNLTDAKRKIIDFLNKNI